MRFPRQEQWFTTPKLSVVLSSLKSSQGQVQWYLVIFFLFYTPMVLINASIAVCSAKRILFWSSDHFLILLWPKLRGHMNHRLMVFNMKDSEPPLMIHLHTTMVIPGQRTWLDGNCSSVIRNLEEHNVLPVIMSSCEVSGKNYASLCLSFQIY